MNVRDVMPTGKCDWCKSTGFVTVYHRAYRGICPVWVEWVDRAGEVHLRREPGTIAAHCSCNLGDWMRVRTEPAVVARIPTMGDVIMGRTPYQLERWDAEDGPADLSESAGTFLAGWREKFGGRSLDIADNPE